MNGEERDFQKEILKALGVLKTEVDGLKKKVDGLEKRMDAMFSFLQRQAFGKGAKCVRVAVTRDNKPYCTVYGYKTVPEGTEKEYIFAGGRYHPKPGAFECFLCTEWEKRE